MKGHLNVNSTVGGPLKLLECYLNYLHLSCQNKKKIFNILVYKISETTYPIELKFSGFREGVNKLAVLKFQSNPDKFEEKCQNMEFWEISNIGISYSPVGTRFNQ